MISVKILNRLLLVITFFFFVTCPTVHTLGEDVRHDIAVQIEVEELQKETEKGVDLSFFKLFPTSHPNLFHHTTNVQEYEIYSSQYFMPKSSILSTIKLIL